jgi:hypothetical protein
MLGWVFEPVQYLQPAIVREGPECETGIHIDS